MRYMISDESWVALGPVVEASRSGDRLGPTPATPDRQFLEGLLYLARTGVPWRDLPAEFGAWDAAYNRFRRWVASGRLRRLFELLTADPQFGTVRRVFVDSTIPVRLAHGTDQRHREGADSARRQTPPKSQYE